MPYPTEPASGTTVQHQAGVPPQRPPSERTPRVDYPYQPGLRRLPRAADAADRGPGGPARQEQGAKPWSAGAALGISVLAFLGFFAHPAVAVTLGLFGAGCGATLLCQFARAAGRARGMAASGLIVGVLAATAGLGGLTGPPDAWIDPPRVSTPSS